MQNKHKKMYSYKAVSKTGTRYKGCGVYCSYHALCSALNGQNLTILRAYRRFFWLDRLRLNHNFIIHMLIGLEWSLSTGQPLSMALKSLEIKGFFGMIMQDVGVHIAQGKLFSEAWSSYTGLISPVVLAFFRQGEVSGNLSHGIKQGRLYLEKRRFLHQQLMSVLRLPLLNLGACLFTGYLLYSEVAQSLIPILLEKHAVLSFWTRTLILLANISWGMIFSSVLASAIALSLVYIFYLPRSKQNLEIFLFRFLPLYSDAQYTHGFEILSSLLNAKVPLLSGLSITQEAVTSGYLKKTFLYLRTFIQEGGNFSDASKHWLCFPQHYVYLLRYGQDHGHLQDAVQHISGLLALRLEFGIQKWMRRLPLFCLGIVACVLLFLIQSIFLPLYDALGEVSHG
ncbi:type II secretion system F family protein [Holospora curviuscula]|uniref:Type IV pilin biogenesis protein n=1 Tax=Holospora curviuscula TaxID=1082868 RepID=A0A2S5R7I2_9PROT|nr:type II secretion system F family protein [Holospora curviuscula]PPE03253.1 type IV pilin biogenesis protein [Holospora curviuscula]